MRSCKCRLGIGRDSFAIENFGTQAGGIVLDVQMLDDEFLVGFQVLSVLPVATLLAQLSAQCCVGARRVASAGRTLIGGLRFIILYSVQQGEVKMQMRKV